MKRLTESVNQGKTKCSSEVGYQRDYEEGGKVCKDPGTDVLGISLSPPLFTVEKVTLN